MLCFLNETDNVAMTECHVQLVHDALRGWRGLCVPVNLRAMLSGALCS